MREKLNSDLKTAMKARESRRLATLRLILAAIKDRDIAARAEDRCGGISEEEIFEVLGKMIRQRRESAKTYEEAGRLDLSESELAEIEIIVEYLPRQLSEDEIRVAVEGVVGEIGATGLKDMGKCMGALKQRFQGTMDFSKANIVVKEMLSQPVA